MNVILRAPLLSISGYGVHSRQVFNWLESRKDINLYTQVVQWGNTSWMINPETNNGIVKRVMDLSRPNDAKADLSFQVQLPDEWEVDLAKTNIGISAVIETDRCNPQWIECMNKMDAVIVPSTHVRDIILNTGTITTNLFVVPEWYHEEIDRDISSPLDLNLETDFNFLTVAQFTGHESDTDRKNLLTTVKWFCEAFENDESVGLVLKTNFGRGTRIDRQITKNKIRQVISEVRNGSFPKIHLVHGNLTPEEIISLYKHPKIKCFLSLTRGEGFGLPILESAACSLPVMTTNWSAHLDFLNLGKFIPIDYKLITVPESKCDNRIFLEGMKWADPIEDDFKKKVTKLKSKYSMPKKWADELSEKVKDQFSSKAIMLKYDEVLEKVIGNNT